MPVFASISIGRRRSEVEEVLTGYFGTNIVRHTDQAEAIAQTAALFLIDDLTNDVHIGRRSSTDRGFLMELSDAEQALQLLRDLQAIVPVHLNWTFSDTVVQGESAMSLLDRWRATGEPPVLNLIRIDDEDAIDGGKACRSAGLSPYVGQEIRVTFSDHSDRQYAARTLARLARRALMEGPIKQGDLFRGIGGEILLADIDPSREFLIQMVNIVL